MAVQFVPSLILYLMVNDFPEDNPPYGQAPAATLVKSTITNGVKVSVVSITREIPWSDVSILLTADNGSVQWYPQTYDLQGGSVMTHYYEAYYLGSTEISLMVCDLAGNGQVNGGDYFALNTPDGLAMGAWYYFSMYYEPTGDMIGSISFTG